MYRPEIYKNCCTRVEAYTRTVAAVLRPRPDYTRTVAPVLRPGAWLYKNCCTCVEGLFFTYESWFLCTRTVAPVIRELWFWSWYSLDFLYQGRQNCPCTPMYTVSVSWWWLQLHSQFPLRIWRRLTKYRWKTSRLWRSLAQRLLNWIISNNILK